MFKRCAEQYRQRYVLGLKAPPGGALIIGRADSAVMADHFREQLAGHAGWTVAQIGELYAEQFEQEVEEAGGAREVVWMKEQAVNIPYQVARKLADRDKDVGVRTAQAYRKQVADAVHPIAVEREIAIVDELWPVPITGFLDIEEETKIIERKTAARKNSSLNPDWRVQGRIYQLGVPKDMFWHQSVKTKDPYAIGDDSAMMEPLDETARYRTRTLVAQTMRQVAWCFETYGPDNPWPDGLAHPWACGFCGYKNRCPWWGN